MNRSTAPPRAVAVAACTSRFDSRRLDARSCHPRSAAVTGRDSGGVGASDAEETSAPPDARGAASRRASAPFRLEDASPGADVFVAREGKERASFSVAEAATSASPRNAGRGSPSGKSRRSEAPFSSNGAFFPLFRFFSAARSREGPLSKPRSPFSTANPTPSAKASAASTAASTAPETALATADCAAASIFSVLEGDLAFGSPPSRGSAKRFSALALARRGEGAPPPPREEDPPTRPKVEALASSLSAAPPGEEADASLQTSRG